jgi:hypothetical protein
MLRASRCLLLFSTAFSVLGAPACAGRAEKTTPGANANGPQEVKYHLVEVKGRPLAWAVLFENAPDFVHALEMAPAAREPELSRGAWLVLAFGAFSVPDCNSIQPAVRAVARHSGAVQLGVRPFWDYAEMRTWFPDYGDSTTSPLWVVLKEGRVRAWDVGAFSEDEIDALLLKALR